MIRKIWSNRPGFKQFKFRNGLNIILTSRSASATAGDKRNAAGKSSLLEVIHFLLGSDIRPNSVLSAPELSEDIFWMTLDLCGSATTISRALNDKSRIDVEGNFSNWPVQPDVDNETGSVSISLDAWRDLLGREFFGLPAKRDIPKGSYLSYRSCFNYFARRANDGGYDHWQSTVARQKSVTTQVNLAFLFGLDPETPLDVHKVKEQETAKKELSRALKTGYLELAIESPSKLKPKLRRAAKAANKLEQELSGFKVIDSYENLEQRANALQKKIEELIRSNILDKELVSDINDALAKETPPDLIDLENIYKEAGVTLPGVSLAKFSAVRLFHQNIIQNRKIHLSAEQEDAQRRIESRSATRNELADKRNQLLNSINSGGALNHYRQLASQLEFSRAEQATLEQQIELANKLSSLNADLKVKKAEAARRMQADLIERNTSIETAASVFDEIEQFMYDEAGIFDIRAEKTGLKFVIEAPDLGSVGVQRAHIFVFDLTLASTCAARKNWPGFLIHDSHVFDGVDGRQISSALTIGDAKTKSFDGQYIVTMNSDDLEKAERESSTSFSNFITKPELDDSDGGGLFGFRFSTPNTAVTKEVQTEE